VNASKFNQMKLLTRSQSLQGVSSKAGAHLVPDDSLRNHGAAVIVPGLKWCTPSKLKNSGAEE
jgi:hypothetical protein